MMYLSLFWEFFKVGLFAVGGGMATIPFLMDMSTRTGWFTTGDLADMIAVSESTPGPIGVNMATYVGYETGGILGALSSTVGLIAPSIVIILVIAKLLLKFHENPLVKTTFSYLRPAVIGTIRSGSPDLCGKQRAYGFVLCSLHSNARRNAQVQEHPSCGVDWPWSGVWTSLPVKIPTKDPRTPS